MFEGHGSFELMIRGNILQARIKGGWNEVTAKEYDVAVRDIISPILAKPWAMISVMDEWELFTPDCRPVIVKLCRYAYTNGLIREVMVNKHQSVKMQQFPLTNPYFPDFQRHIVSTISEAEEWLGAEGFNVCDETTHTKIK